MRGAVHDVRIREVRPSRPPRRRARAHTRTHTHEHTLHARTHTHAHECTHTHARALAPAHARAHADLEATTANVGVGLHRLIRSVGCVRFRQRPSGAVPRSTPHATHSTHRAARARCNAEHAPCNAMHRARRAPQLGAAQQLGSGSVFMPSGDIRRRRAGGRLASLQRIAQATAERCTAAMLRCAERCACWHRRPRHTAHLAHRRASCTKHARSPWRSTTDNGQLAGMQHTTRAMRCGQRGPREARPHARRAEAARPVAPQCAHVATGVDARAHTAGSGSVCTSYDKTYHRHIETHNAHSAHAHTRSHARTHTHTHTHSHTDAQRAGGTYLGTAGPPQ